jgi:hypothetical protein
MKSAIATYENIDTLLWWHEELNCRDANDIIVRRLEEGERPSFSYGKLMERLLHFKRNNLPFVSYLIPIAEKVLHSMTLPLEPPVVVIGDASGSMEVAIRTATIIASLLTVLSNAELRFFHTENFFPPVQVNIYSDCIVDSIAT